MRHTEAGRQIPVNLSSFSRLAITNCCQFQFFWRQKIEIQEPARKTLSKRTPPAPAVTSFWCQVFLSLWGPHSKLWLLFEWPSPSWCPSFSVPTWPTTRLRAYLPRITLICVPNHIRTAKLGFITKVLLKGSGVWVRTHLLVSHHRLEMHLTWDLFSKILPLAFSFP